MNKTIGELIERLDDDQYVALGSGVHNRKRGQPSGTNYYFIGKVGRFKKEIDVINAKYKLRSEDPDEYVPLEDRMINDIWNRHIPGEPPMLAVLGEGVEAGEYSLLSECDKAFKAPPPKINDTSGFQNLRIAIAKKAAEDYVERIKEYGSTKDLDHFFESEWGEMITGADGKKIEEVCRLKARYAIWRDEHNCGKCSRKNCIHYDGTHFTTMEKGRIFCLKEAKEDEGNS